MSLGAPESARRFEVLTFDCYGTLIDWYAGVRAAARAAPSLAGIDVERFVRDRDACDRELIQGPYAPYSTILSESARLAALLQGRAMNEHDSAEFAASIVAWPPFAESHACLTRLAARFRLGILSNVDTATLERSVALLRAPFEFLVTAQMLRSYKPRPAHWIAALEQLDVGLERVLHVGCSKFHDLRPAQALGIATAFVDREDEGLDPADPPAFHVRDLTALCARLDY